MKDSTEVTAANLLLHVHVAMKLMNIKVRITSDDWPVPGKDEISDRLKDTVLAACVIVAVAAVVVVAWSAATSSGLGPTVGPTTRA
jgi:hypothetical protein